jgi:NAD(P)H-hydrate repair Nnr-like enzyme with NAD(P)H-hydrate dehydratase domain
MQEQLETEKKKKKKEFGEDYPILTFADILRALKQHPEWLEELRKLVLTSELLGLPKKIDELIKRVEKLEKIKRNLKKI